ncbi:hypothetical protein [uncultured Mucilaginibacter sp.]|uniref:hypothetical protein n=1 Tax=uncultured Mucilaginibacter sp. TaxID=797541 RepID=UPI00261474F6|nr:hypothetical protein [uncultured Mucilaginibacter sp.]
MAFTLIQFTAFGQAEVANQNKLKNYEDSLKTLGFTVVNNENDLERKNANYHFIRTLVAALKIPGSYNYKFDSVKTVSLLYSPDNQFRIFSWNVMNEDGSFRYYGSIQMNTKNELKLYPLTDYTPFLPSPEDSVLTPQKWLGAQYYKIVKVGEEHPYYVLLGWKGNNVKSTKKVIEILSYKNSMPVFGAPVFANEKNKKRIVFEYSRQASMLLRYVPDKQLIVFDHLAPPDPKVKVDRSFYGPDLTYDGYQLKNGKWNLVQDLDMRNIPEDRDEGYVDPKKPQTGSATTVKKKPSSSLSTKNSVKKS